MTENLNIRIIGIGGVGTHLSEYLSRYFNYVKDLNVEMTLIDGDEFERKNHERQTFTTYSNKGQTKCRELSVEFPNINHTFCRDYVTNDNIAGLIKSGDIVFVAVDNHKSRKIISDYCATLDDIILISGGNEYHDGNVQLYVRKEGIDRLPRITDYHPEIEKPADKLPTELSCEEASVSEPQLLFANIGVAVLMTWTLYYVLNTEKLEYSEVYFDMMSISVLPKKRNLKNR